MKAMLLAAGRGERLRPLTDDTAKPLIKAKQKSLIEYHLENLHNAGINDVVINTCWMAEKIVAQLGNGDHYGVNITYSHEHSALETAGGVANALTLLGDDPFLLISADIWCDIDLSLFNRTDTSMLAHLLLVNNPRHNTSGDFSLEKDHVKKSPVNQYTYSGMGIFEPALFRNLPTGKTPLRDVLSPAVATDKVSGQHHNGQWFDIGTVERLAELEAHLTR